jgi:hypothetical protein
VAPAVACWLGGLTELLRTLMLPSATRRTNSRMAAVAPNGARPKRWDCCPAQGGRPCPSSWPPQQSHETRLSSNHMMSLQLSLLCMLLPADEMAPLRAANWGGWTSAKARGLGWWGGVWMQCLRAGS